jgi:hypothetical protein
MTPDQQNYLLLALAALAAWYLLCNHKEGLAVKSTCAIPKGTYTKECTGCTSDCNNLICGSCPMYNAKTKKVTNVASSLVYPTCKGDIHVNPVTGKLTC